MENQVSNPNTSNGQPTSSNIQNTPQSSSGIPSPETNGLEMSQIVLTGQLVQIPTVLIVSEGALRATVTLDAFNRLSEEAKTYLKRFLPISENEGEQQKNLEAAFTRSQSFNFGNPLGKFHSKLKNGWFNPDRPSERVQLKDNQRVMYDHYIRFYQINLLKKLLASRHTLLQHHMGCSPLEDPGTIPLDPQTMKKKEQYHKIQTRASKRARLMISDCRSRSGEYGMSSDDDEDDSNGRTVATAQGRTTLHAPHHKDMDLHQPTYLDDIKTMLKKYKRLKKMEPNTPSLDITDISLDDVLERSGVQSVSERIRQTKQTLERMNQ